MFVHLDQLSTPDISNKMLLKVTDKQQQFLDILTQISKERYEQDRKIDVKQKI